MDQGIIANIKKFTVIRPTGYWWRKWMTLVSACMTFWKATIFTCVQNIYAALNEVTTTNTKCVEEFITKICEQLQGIQTRISTKYQSPVSLTLVRNFIWTWGRGFWGTVWISFRGANKQRLYGAARDAPYGRSRKYRGTCSIQEVWDKNYGRGIFFYREDSPFVLGSRS